MAKDKLITNTQIKKALQDSTQGDLILLITEIAQTLPQAREFLTSKFPSGDNIGAVLDKYKQKVEYEFFPKRGFGRLNLREAKKAISDFKKICNDKAMVVDIMLFYVENCVKFTDEYGDINEAFYNSAVSVYASVVKEINSGDLSLYNVFAERLKQAVRNACEGWGFQDEMMEVYGQISYLDEYED